MPHLNVDREPGNYFNQWFDAMRGRYDLVWEEVADLLGIRESEVRRLRAGHSRPGESLRKLMGALFEYGHAPAWPKDRTIAKARIVATELPKEKPRRR